MVATSHGQRTIDSAQFDARTLSAFWERSYGADTTLVAFSHGRISGTASRPHAPSRAIDTTATAPVYSSTMDELVVQSLALAPGYLGVLSFWDGDRVERDTVRVRRTRNASREASLGPAADSVWIVDFDEPYATETLWIRRDTRAIVKHTYRWRRDGTQSEVRVRR